MEISSWYAGKLLGVTPSTIHNYRLTSNLPARSVQHGLRTYYVFELEHVLAFARANNIQVSEHELRKVHSVYDSH